MIETPVIVMVAGVFLYECQPVNDQHRKHSARFMDGYTFNIFKHLKIYEV
jgi:hypothetical protein